MNAGDIKRRLMVDRYRRAIVCPNYTPVKWFECDVFELTAAGYFREYEIKLSLSDFRADRKKNQRNYDWANDIQTSTHKHTALAAGDPNGPAQFWFVAPEGLIPHAELPAWAGLIEATSRAKHARPWSVLLTETVKAPRLHPHKANERLRQKVESVFYYRFMDSFLHLRDCTCETQITAPALAAEIHNFETHERLQ